MLLRAILLAAILSSLQSGAAADLRRILTAAWPPLAAAAPGDGGFDLDGDGLSDLIEVRFGSDPTKPDTDLDGWDDKAEYEAGTRPRDKNSFPIFTLLARDRQLLVGDLLVLRARAFTNALVTTNFVITTNETDIGTQVPDGEDGTPGGCDLDGDGVVDEPGITCPRAGDLITNEVPVTNYVTWQWYWGTNVLASQTNESLVLHRTRLEDAGDYWLQAEFLTSEQVSRRVAVELLDLPARVRVPQPIGDVFSWGLNPYQQTNVPNTVTQVVAVAAGLAHSAVIRTDGTAVAWGSGDQGQTNVPPNATNLVSLVAGAVQTFALRADGRVIGWGTNEFSQLDFPPSLTNVTALAAGYFHAIALRQDGTVVCWGDNSQGQCEVPEGLEGVIAVAAGVFHTVALTSDGQVHCWGGNDLKQCTVPEDLPEVGAIAAGGNHTVAVLRSGQLVAWGDNSFSQTEVPPDLGNVTQVAAGYSFTAAVKPDGRLVLFGEDSPRIKTIPKGLTNTVLLATGYFHTVAVHGRVDDDGDGLDNVLEHSMRSDPDQFDTDGDSLEDGVELRLGSSPLSPDADGDGLPDRAELENGFDPLVPTEAADGFLTVLPGVQLKFFTLGLGLYQLQSSLDGVLWNDIGDPYPAAKGISYATNRADLPAEARFFRLLPPSDGDGTAPSAPPVFPGIAGTVAAWGNNELGQGTVPLDVTDVAQLSAGAWHTLALLQNGTVRGWGLDSDGQSTPPEGLATVRAIAAGGHHSLALLEDGSLVGWGRNSSGQSPPSVAGPFVALAAGGLHSLALTSEGVVVAFGANLSGQTDPPSGMGRVTAIAAGWGHSVALSEDGQVFCWGDNQFGQCNVPLNLPPAASIAAGNGHTLVALRDGRVVCWGNNENGQCTPPEGLGAVIRLGAGFNRSLAQLEDGRVVFWGEGAAALNTALEGYPVSGVVAAGGYHVAATKEPVDADGDLLDDALEVRTGTDPLKTDTDGDGLDDATELLAGFDPTSPTEAVDGTTTILPAVKLRYFTLPGTVYRFQSSSNLAEWRNLGSRIRDRSGFTEVVVSATGEVQFYRLITVP